MPFILVRSREKRGWHQGQEALRWR